MQKKWMLPVVALTALIMAWVFVACDDNASEQEEGGA